MPHESQHHASQPFRPGRYAGELRLDEPMARHTSWQTGGTADYYYAASSRDDLASFLRRVPESMPLTCFGRGSNMLVRDGGVRGVVLAMTRSLSELSLVSDGAVQSGAGEHCARVARFAADHGLSGAEFLIGIPGSMGGALAMNAGAWGSAIWDLVQEVCLFDRKGHFSTHPADEFEPGYRELKSALEGWFFSCRLRLRQADRATCWQKIRALLEQRVAEQPLGQRSCGSVFKNPPGDYAARLIEFCGLKGTQLGGARVSEKHANFIINDGTASAADIEQLIERVRDTVRERCGVALETEVRIIGTRARVGGAAEWRDDS